MPLILGYEECSVPDPTLAQRLGDDGDSIPTIPNAHVFHLHLRPLLTLVWKIQWPFSSILAPENSLLRHAEDSLPSVSRGIESIRSPPSNSHPFSACRPTRLPVRPSRSANSSFSASTSPVINNLLLDSLFGGSSAATLEHIMLVDMGKLIWT